MRASTARACTRSGPARKGLMSTSWMWGWRRPSANSRYCFSVAERLGASPRGRRSRPSGGSVGSAPFAGVTHVSGRSVTRVSGHSLLNRKRMLFEELKAPLGGAAQPSRHADPPTIASHAEAELDHCLIASEQASIRTRVRLKIKNAARDRNLIANSVCSRIDGDINCVGSAGLAQIDIENLQAFVMLIDRQFAGGVAQRHDHKGTVSHATARLVGVPNHLPHEPLCPTRDFDLD